MDIKLINSIYDVYVKSLENLNFDIFREAKFDIIHNKIIKDEYSNFISNFDVHNEKELENIVNVASKKFEEMNRKLVIYLTPNMKELYDNRDKYFNKESYQLLSEEVWQVFTDFENLDKIETNCNMNIELVETYDYDEFGKLLVSNYQTGNNDDPYGNLDDGYKESFRYNQKAKDVKCDFYFVKANGEIIGTTESVYNNDILGIYSLTIKSDYRQKGIGKEVLKKQLEMCKEKNIKIAFLQTEKDFYPAKMYNKVGFIDLAYVYYYTKI